jgi:Skp family chaperone for outer membrane proteins
MARWALAAVAAATFVCFGASAQLAEPTEAEAKAKAKAKAKAAAPAAVILFIDRKSVIERSTVGADMIKQAEALLFELGDEFTLGEEQFKAEIAAHDANRDKLTPAAQQEQFQAMKDRQEAFHKTVEARQSDIKRGTDRARNEIEAKLAPILEQILLERRANLLLDRNLVILGATEIDITQDVIKRLNSIITKVTVTPIPPPAKDAVKQEQTD